MAKEVVGYLRRSGVPKSLAEDIVQDVFVTMLEMDLPLPKEKIRAWMYRVSLRRYIDRYRRDKRYMELLQHHFIPKESCSPFENSQYDDIHTALAELPDEKSQLLDLYYFQGFSVKEIATLFACSESKIKVDLHRGRQALKYQLEKKGYKNGNI